MISNFKKIVIALAIISTHSACAGAMGELNIPPYDGFYLGADIGLANLLDKEHHAINPETQHLGSFGILGGGFIGYDYSISERFKLGIEGFGNANGLNTSIHHYNTGTVYKANARYNAGVRILPGYAFYPELIGHVILGYSNAQFRILDNGTYGFINRKFNQGGFQSGLGWVASVTPHFLVRIDALYTRYSKNTSAGLTNTTPATIQYYSNRFSTLEGDLALIYKFS